MQATMDEEIFNTIQSSIANVLITAQNAQNKEASESAIAQFLQWENNYFPMWMTALAFELADDSKKESPSRQIAGLTFRRNLDADTPERMQMVVKRWLEISVDVRAHIKAKLLDTMGSGVAKYRHLAAQCFGQIAVLEISSWIDCIDVLHRIILMQGGSDYLKEAALIALETICRSAPPQEYAKKSDKVVEAINTGMDSPYVELKVVATKALLAVVGSMSAGDLEIDHCKGFLAQALNAANFADASVRLYAYECLVLMINPYYYCLELVIDKIYEATLNCIRTDSERDVVLQAIEFWTSLSEEEACIVDENARRLDQDPTCKELHPMYHFVSKAAPTLCGVLCQCVEREIDLDLEQWTITSAASACLSAISVVITKDVIPLVMPFINTKIMENYDNARASALLVFGAIMDGPTIDDVKETIVSSLPVVLNCLSSQTQLVKSTAAWVLRRIAQYHAPALNDRAQLEPYLRALCQSLNEDARIAAICCEAIEKLAGSVDKPSPENPLNPYFNDLFCSLLAASNRPDAYRENLRLCALEALRILILVVPDNSLVIVEGALNHFASYLNNTVLSGNNPETSELQGQLCGILATCVSRLGKRIEPLSSNVMELMFNLMRNSTSSSVHQECFMTISFVVQALGEQFQQFLPSYVEFLFYALVHWEDTDLCKQAVYSVTDLCLYLPEQFKIYSQRVIEILLFNVVQPNISPYLAPNIVSCLSDVGHTLGNDFVDHLPKTMGVFFKASEVATTKTSDITDAEQIESINMWRETILAAYSMLILTFTRDKKNELKDYIPNIILTLKAIADDSGPRVDSISRAMCCLILDISEYFGNQFPAQLRSFLPFIAQVMNSSFSSPETTRSAKLAKEVVEKLP